MTSSLGMSMVDDFPLKEGMGVRLSPGAPILHKFLKTPYTQTMENRETLLLQRYFRKTIAHPEGAVVHHGDCDFFSIKICGCGLHHDLKALDAVLQAQHYPLFDLEQAEYEEVRAGLMEARPKPIKKKKKT